MELLKPGTHVHLVGIGGIGLSAIARVLNGWGYRVTGSDRQLSALTEALVGEGIAVYEGHHAGNVAGVDVLVVSSAVPQDNPEVDEARQQGIPVVKRVDFLEALTAGKTVIAVAGTHGKTTTAALIAWIFVQAGLEPTFIVGGLLRDLGTNARAGAGPHFIIEADEYDRAFLGLRPDVAVVTTLEYDHPDCYPTFEAMQAAFDEFVDRVPANGLLLVNGEQEAVRLLGTSRARRGLRTETYGLSPRWEWWAKDIRLGDGAAFEAWHDGQKLGVCQIQLPGRHNVSNAVAALAVAAAAGVDGPAIRRALSSFGGTARRFEVKGEAGGVIVIDDYAHHPTEIRVTLAAARSRYPGRRICTAFQPHTYSRTAALLDDFATAFQDADHVIVTAVYAARESNSVGVSGADLALRIFEGSGVDARYVETLEAATAAVLEQIRPGDVVLTLGAGDGYRIGEEILERLQR